MLHQQRFLVSKFDSTGKLHDSLNTSKESFYNLTIEMKFARGRSRGVEVSILMFLFETFKHNRILIMSWIE